MKCRKTRRLSIVQEELEPSAGGVVWCGVMWCNYLCLSHSRFMTTANDCMIGPSQRHTKEFVCPKTRQEIRTIQLDFRNFSREKRPIK